jgi:hypothetical protein
MNDEWDDARNEFIDSLYDDFAKEVLEGRSDLHGLVIAQFVSERLHSYYVNTPRIWTVRDGHSRKLDSFCQHIRRRLLSWL